MHIGEKILCLLKCIWIVHIVGLFITSIVYLIVSSVKIHDINEHWVDGVHKTTFNFDGNYTIIGEIINDRVWYVGYCLASTLTHGNCEYRYYKSTQEDETYYYTELYCGSNGSAASLDGYISTDIQQCQIEHFNNNADNLHHWKKAHLFGIIGISVTIVEICILQIFDRLNNNKN